MAVKSRPFKRVLIANRGEIAVRIARTLRELGIESVALYSEADRHSMHRTMCDYAVHLPGSASADTYLAIPKIIEAVKLSGADAVHPGYGFLSENADFSAAVAAAGATFIGPTPEAMHLMGDKIAAKNFMIAHGIPVVPGVTSGLKNVQELNEAIDKIGFPVIIKAAAGGGGRGMRVVRQREELAEAFAACQREALAYFGNPEVFCERYMENPRHIEIQVLADQFGNGVHFFERDCSIQRRHQKLFEEAPSPFLNDEQRERLGQLAIRAAVASNYTGVGTVEFICDNPEEIFFMEMNTRIQVEHPVTEMICQVDLIREQILVAMGEKISFQQSDIAIHGWAMEARINAEDATKNFMPSPGTVSHIRFPLGPFVRIDSHLYPGYEIPSAYDSMVAKVIVWGRNRHEALERMARALAELDVHGVPTTTAFHEALLAHEDFRSGNFTTHFIAKNQKYFDATLGHSDALPKEYPAAVAASLAQVATDLGAKVDDRRAWMARGRAEAVHKS
jgi:acetyl-CoA carboxylase biotin carboxylase subunit